MPLTISPRDPRIHVFEIAEDGPSLPRRTYLSAPDEADDGTAIRDALGAPVDVRHAEVFAVRDVAPLGLRTYLMQAHDIAEATLAKDATRLDALGGDVLILAPRAVEVCESLEPAEGLAHVGSYAPVGADDAPRDLPRAAPEPRRAAPETAGGRALDRRAVMAIVVAALVLAALVLILV